MIPPQLLAGGAALALIAGFLGGWTVRDWKADAAALAAVEKADKLRDRMQGKVDAKAGELEALRVQHGDAATITNTQLREIYHDRTIPADCAVPDAARSVLDVARNRANAEAAGSAGPAVPGPAGDPEPVDRP